MHSMTVTTLLTLVAKGESLTLELKKSTAEKDRAYRTLCAFANGQGGQLVFGVTPAGKVIGQRVTDRTLEELAQELQCFEPPLFPRVQRIKWPMGWRPCCWRLTLPHMGRCRFAVCPMSGCLTPPA